MNTFVAYRILFNHQSCVYKKMTKSMFLPLFTSDMTFPFDKWLHPTYANINHCELSFTTTVRPHASLLFNICGPAWSVLIFELCTSFSMITRLPIDRHLQFLDVHSCIICIIALQQWEPHRLMIHSLGFVQAICIVYS